MTASADTVDRALSDPARRVHQQAGIRGWHTQKEIQRLREKHLFSIRRGVYVWFDDFKSATPLEQHRMRVAALTLVLTSPGVLSHQTAAAELDLDLLDADLAQLHVTRPSGAGSRIEAGVVHHSICVEGGPGRAC
jgi:hypothetical protein